MFMKECNIDKSQIVLYLYGELDEASKLSLEKHLAECAECRAEADDYCRIVDKLSRLPVVEPANVNVATLQMPYPKKRILKSATYSAIAASFLILAVFTYLKLSTLNTTATSPDTHTVTNVSISQDKELYAWDSGISDEIDSLKESAKTIGNDLKTSPLASWDDSLDKIDTDIKTISTKTD